VKHAPKKRRSCKYLQDVESMRIFILDLFFISLLMNKQSENKCCTILEPPQIVKVMQFVCDTCNKENVEVVNTLKRVKAHYDCPKS